MPNRSRTHKKNPAAVELGRRGGLARGRTVLECIPAEQRRAMARHAAQARWAQVRAEKKDGATEKKP
jgi:hypothetical protein